jgi:hypothetical protein|tara:strand:- start:397 stop:675 length:279 start_codon:yes stop_codon:yes gene_type:complete
MKMTSVRQISFSREIQKIPKFSVLPDPSLREATKLTQNSQKKSYVAQLATRKKFGLLLSPTAKRQTPSAKRQTTRNLELSRASWRVFGTKFC